MNEFQVGIYQFRLKATSSTNEVLIGYPNLMRIDTEAELKERISMYRYDLVQASYKDISISYKVEPIEEIIDSDYLELDDTD